MSGGGEYLVVQGLTLLSPSGVVGGHIYVDGDGVMQIVPTDRVDMRGRTVVIHADSKLKIDCAGVGHRYDLVGDQVNEWSWRDPAARGVGLSRHAPEIPIDGPPLSDWIASAPAGAPFDRWSDAGGGP